MSAAAELLVLERRASLERLRASASRLAAHPAVALTTARVRPRGEGPGSRRRVYT